MLYEEIVLKRRIGIKQMFLNIKVVFMICNPFNLFLIIKQLRQVRRLLDLLTYLLLIIILAARSLPPGSKWAKLYQYMYMYMGKFPL